MSEETNTAVLEVPSGLSDERKAAIRAGIAAAKERKLKGQIKHSSARARMAQGIANDALEKAAIAELKVEAAAAVQTPEQKAFASGVLPEEDFGSIIQVGIEGRTNGMNRGVFEPPAGFDSEKYGIAWGSVEAGTLEAWPSIAELQQPRIMPGTDIQFPGWKVYRLPDGKMFKFKKGNGELAMLYTLREHWIKINAATAAVSRRLGKAVKDKMIASTAALPADVQAQQIREEEQEKATFLQLQRMAQMQAT